MLYLALPWFCLFQGVCSDIEGYFDPAKVIPIMNGFRLKLEVSGSDHSDTLSEVLSDSDSDDDMESNKEGDSDRMTEAVVVSWLYSAGFPQYVDVFQSIILEINFSPFVHLLLFGFSPLLFPSHFSAFCFFLLCFFCFLFFLLFFNTFIYSSFLHSSRGTSYQRS